ncbi:hypothetical protein M3N64_10165 [Sporolactobacillus sp. CPB3-1]|uniref:DUF3006 domain-containing protein n=1 Tax=Sporolactobacillus mangiferae TaxID=2940498 RepID=A0ABT0MBR2_9BACL|nr:hypothetical protein [Sporolactobacillus mangiferae]MCL1632302.1 hypothetical protein [Sporolactobacillus mangiferae]
MIRTMFIVQFIDRSESWHLQKTVQINARKSRYQKGDIIVFDDREYIVIEDHTYLRVTTFNRKINPLKPLSDQIPNI